MTCTCCNQPFLLTCIAVLVGTFMLNQRIRKMGKTGSIIGGVLMSIWSMGIFLLGSLIVSDQARSMLFAKFLQALSGPSALDTIRCPLVNQVSGSVLEIGPGAGANFRCWKDNRYITEWVGIESNTYMENALKNGIQMQNITFPTRVEWYKADERNSTTTSAKQYDYIVATHVLCSVSDLDSLFETVAKSLRSGGSFIFLEHTMAEPGSFMAKVQNFIEPLLFYVGNGCQFKPTREILETSVTSGALKDYYIDIAEVEAPLGLAFMKPHVRGKITKPYLKGWLY